MRQKLKFGYGPIAPRIPFWTFATTVCGICEPGHKVQLTPAQRAIWKSYDRRVGLDVNEMLAYMQLTDLDPWHPGDLAPPFLQLVLTRGGGKSLLLATIAVYEAVTNEYEAAPGETVVVVALAPRLKQSKDMFRYAAAHFERPGLKPLLARPTTESTEEIILGNGRFLRTQAVDRSGGAARGPTYITALFDESAFLSCDGVIIDAEQWQAIIAGARGVSDFHGVLSSTPNGKAGFFWETFRDSYRSDGSWHVFLGPQPLVRPDMDPRLLEEYKRTDPDAFEREFMCSFDACGVEKFFDPRQVENCVRIGVTHVPPRGPEVQYSAAVDPTGGAHDWMTLSVVERLTDGTVRQCVTEGWDPTAVDARTTHEIAAEIARILAPYGIRKVCGDIFGGAWVQEAFAAVGIEYEVRGFNATQLVQRASLLRELFRSQRIELLDEPIQTAELKEYEKRVLKSGRVTAGKPIGGSDDYVDSLALSTWELIGDDVKLHPPDSMVKWDPVKWRKELFDGAYPDPSVKESDTLEKIVRKGEGPAWTIQNWSKDWRYCQCSVGELAWLCGVGPAQLCQVLGKDLVLQLCWARWILAHWKSDPDVILRCHFGLIPGFEEVKAKLRGTRDLDNVITYDSAGGAGVKRGFTPPDWQPIAVRSRSEVVGVSTVAATPPWTAPPAAWGLDHDIEKLYGQWPDRPWTAAVNRLFSSVRARLGRATNNLRDDGDFSANIW